MYASPPADTHKDVRHVRLGKASLQLGRTSKREIATVGDSPLPGFVVHAGPPAKAVTHSGDVFVLLRVSLNRLRPAGHLVGSSFHRRSSRVDRFEQAVHIGYRDQGFTFTSVLSGGGWARWHCFLTSRCSAARWIAVVRFTHTHEVAFEMICSGFRHAYSIKAVRPSQPPPPPPPSRPESGP